MKLTEMTEAELVAAKGIEDGLAARTSGAARMKHRGRALAMQRQIDRMRGVSAPKPASAPETEVGSATCHHCKKAITGESVAFRTDGKTRHYHEEHAHHALPEPSHRPAPNLARKPEAGSEKHDELVHQCWIARTTGGTTRYVPPGGGTALALDEAYERMQETDEDDWF